MKKINFSNILKIDNFEIFFNKDQKKIMLAIIIILIVILLFRKNLYYLIERIIVISIIFLIILVVTKNLLASIIGSILIFLLINMTMNYKNKVEQFQNPIIPNSEKETKTESEKDKQKASAENMKKIVSELSNKPLPVEDTVPTNNTLGAPLSKYSDDSPMTPVRKAQIESFELIDSIKMLKDTIETFGPVLSEGKKIMSLFENMKI
jgi:energy-coupling factor transporter transmembrane protein EcfT